MAITDTELAAIIDREFAAIPVRWTYQPLGALLIPEARRQLGDLLTYPVSFMCAIFEKESWGRNIFGCDTNTLYCQDMVTRWRTQKLIEFVKSGQGYSNGVGPAQLTFFPYIEKAEALGGAHKLSCQIPVAAEVLRGLIRSYGYYGGIGAYNAGWLGRDAVRWTYTADVERMHEWWVGKLT